MKRSTKITLRTKIYLTIGGLLALTGVFYAANPVPFASIPFPTGVAAAPDLLLVSEYCNDHIDMIDCQGNASLFLTIPGFGSCREQYMAMAPSQSAKAGFTPRDLFVTQGALIYKATPPGPLALFATIPCGADDHNGITFDHFGTFGFNMIVTCEVGGGVWTIDGTGIVTPIASTGTQIEGPAVVPPLFGPHGGEIWVADEINSQVHAIKNDGTVTLNILSHVTAEGVHVIPSPPCTFCSGGAFFQAEQQLFKLVWQYPLSDFIGLGGNVILVSEAGFEGADTSLVTFDGTNYVQSSFGPRPPGVDEGAYFVDCDVPTATPTSTPTPTFTPTPTATATATFTPTATATATFTPTPTATATFTPTPTATATATATATFTPTATATATATATFTPTPTSTSTSTATATATATAMFTPTATATFTPTPTATATFTPTPTATATFTPTPTPATPSPTPTLTPCALASCSPPYPFVSGNPRTNIPFNESEVLRAFRMTVDAQCNPQTLQMFYNDEHAMTLGVRQVQVKTSCGITPTNYPISMMVGNPSSAIPPIVGSTVPSGAEAGTDVAGRPMFPAMFVTDVTATGDPLAGDWQFGGTAIPPDATFGTWKGAVRTVDKTKIPNAVNVIPDADPATNDWNLGPGSDPVPPGLVNQGYGNECRWNLSSLNLVPGHVYRLYFMVHDGDQNNVGGDVGQDCVFFVMPGTAPTPTPTATASPTPTPTPTSTPGEITVISKTFGLARGLSAKAVTVTFQNDTAVGQVLTGLAITWPQAINGNLISIKMGATTIYNTPTGGGTLTTSSLLGTTAQRTMAAGLCATLTFTFANNVSPTRFDYTGSATFDPFGNVPMLP